MRIEACLKSYKKYPTLTFNQIPTTYDNQYFNKKMQLKACDFYWACSRKSYLPCGQSYDVFSYDAITLALSKGARLINLDVSSDTENNPIVQANTLMPKVAKPLSFDKCCELIAKDAWTGNNYPLILFIGILADNYKMIAKMGNSIKNHFSGRLLNKKYSFSGRNNMYPFPQIPIEELMGRVAIIVDKYPTVGTFDELVNASVLPNQQFLWIQDYSQTQAAHGGIEGGKIATKDIIAHNYENITIINPSGNVNDYTNVYNPKVDLYNPPPKDCWKYGIQMVMMNYQLYDTNMKEYIEFFKNGGLVLKPDNLRYIPKPKPPIIPQNTSAYYKLNTYSQPGWYSFNM